MGKGMEDTVSIVIFEGGQPASEIEKKIAGVRQAILLDNLSKIKQIKQVGSIYLLTNYSPLAEKAALMGVKVVTNEIPAAQFHFGKVFRDLLNKEKLKNVFYMGGASIPLVTIQELEEVCCLLLSGSGVVYSNNPQSADIVAFSPGNLINRIKPPRSDNILAIALEDEAGVKHKLLRATTGFTFDLDTPSDLLILAHSPFTSSRVSKKIKELGLDLSPLARAKDVLRGDYEEVLLLGRVGAPIIAHINNNLKVRLRIFSEERGMKALGREERGQVISLMGYFLEELGPFKFIKYMERVARCAFLDTRVLMAHFQLQPAPEERFLSDLGFWQELKNPLLREFTRATVEAEIPIIRGGHSLVLGGLWALVDEIGPTY